MNDAFLSAWFGAVPNVLGRQHLEVHRRAKPERTDLIELVFRKDVPGSEKEDEVPSKGLFLKGSWGRSSLGYSRGKA